MQASKMSREAWRKMKELEEARKAGNAPAEVDEEGRDINPHIPQYMTKVPFFYGTSGPTLKHQRQLNKKEYAPLEARTQRGVMPEAQATRYRKGACENCGAISHSKDACLERPRKLGARHTGAAIAADEFIPQELPLSFDGKRDRWADYDVAQHKRVVEEYERIEQERRRLRAEELTRKDKERAAAEAAAEAAGQAAAPVADPLAKEDSASEGESDNEDGRADDADEMKYAESADMAGAKIDSKERISVRNLRIREDTAKYLLNLDINSAHYDPKTRSMRSNPLAHTGKNPAELPYAGDNFVRYTGDVSRIAERQIFAWEAADKGADIHLQADPTKAELMHKTYKVKKEQFKDQLKDSILEKYGGQEHLQAPPKELLMAQTENYVVYSKSGKPLSGAEKPTVLSRYEEDVYPGNHTTVWGSYWRAGKWGFTCCHSFERNSYCTGKAGREANDHEAPTEALALTEAAEKPSAEVPKSLVEEHQQRLKDKAKRAHEDDDEARRAKVATFMKQHKEQGQEAEQLLATDERQRKYNSAKRDYKEVSEEEMEAFRLARVHKDDPMAQFKA